MSEIRGYRKTYRMRTPVPDRKSVEVTFPYEVVERKARSQGLSVPEFLERFQAVAEYDNFDGVLYTFEEIPSEKEQAGVKKPLIQI